MSSTSSVPFTHLKKLSKDYLKVSIFTNYSVPKLFKNCLSFVESVWALIFPTVSPFDGSSFVSSASVSFVPAFLFQRVVFDWIGLYATNPFRVLFSIMIVNVIFSFIYTLFYSANNYLTCMDPGVDIVEMLFGNLYFSAITFFTVGYGDCSPIGFFKLLSPIEGFIGVFLMSYFTVAFVRKILR